MCATMPGATTLFPHESTGDQFFSEEQFEVYRALGFHIAHGFCSARRHLRRRRDRPRNITNRLLNGEDDILVYDDKKDGLSLKLTDLHPNVKAVHDALL